MSGGGRSREEMPGSVLGLLGGAAEAGEREGGARDGPKDRSQPLRVGGDWAPNPVGAPAVHQGAGLAPLPTLGLSSGADRQEQTEK